MQPADASIQDRTPTSILQTAEYKTATFPPGWLGWQVKTADKPRAPLAAHPAGTRKAGFGRRAGGFVRPTQGGRVLSQVDSLTKSWP